MSESLRDTIANAYDSVTAQEVKPDTGVVESTIPGPEVPAPVEVPEKPGRTAGRARDEKGQLLPGPAVKPEPVVAAPVEPSKPRPPRPSSWKKEYWDDYEKLDPRIAEYISQRENEFAKGVSTYKSEWDQVRPIAEAVAPFAPLLQQHNLKPEVWIQSMGNAHKALATGNPQEKASMFLKLAQDYQVPLESLFVQGNDGKLYFNPQVQAYQPPAPPPQDVAQTVRQILLEQNTANEIQAFATSTDDKGQLKHPHFETVKSTMQGHLSAELATDIADAYKQAINHPRHADIAKALHEQEAKAEIDRKAKEQVAAVARARGQAISPKGSAPAVADTGKPKGVRAAIESAYDQVVGGGRV